MIRASYISNVNLIRSKSSISYPSLSTSIPYLSKTKPLNYINKLPKQTYDLDFLTLSYTYLFNSMLLLMLPLNY